MYTKAAIFNLALGALLLNRQIADADADPCKEAVVLRAHYPTALRKTLEDLDLDATRMVVDLELVTTNPDDLWKYAYKYPSNCALLRRIRNCALTDTRENQIRRQTGIFNGQKVIFTDEYQAKAEILPDNFSLSILSASAGLALGYKLAELSSPLISGKGARELRDQIKNMYAIAKIDAEEHDQRENANFETDEEQSEWASARTS